MSEKVLIARSDQKEIYRVGDKTYKAFAPGFPKAEVLNEAMNTARVEETDLHIPKILAVTVEDGRWTIVKEYIEGKTLAELMEEQPEKKKEYLEKFVELQQEVNSKKCPLLNRLKEKLSRQIDSVEELDDISRYELQTRLDGMPKHLKLCHGDFEPKNIIVKGDEYYIIDWVHATQGNASADAARTYLLLALEDQETADEYLDLFCEKTNTEKTYVQKWLPIVAAAQLTKKRPQEKELLMRWLNVVDYE